MSCNILTYKGNLAKTRFFDFNLDSPLSGYNNVAPTPPDAVQVMDRGYNDFKQLYRINLIPAYFVIRPKNNLRYRRIRSLPVDKSTGVQYDQIIVLTGPRSKIYYPDALRRVRYFDSEQNRRFVFLTNNFAITADTVAAIYHCRWLVELFFKLIKGNLKIKSFYGTSPNAVKTQIWIAISVYLLVAILKKNLDVPVSIHNFMQILEVNLFEKKPINQIVTEALEHEIENVLDNQLILFNF